MGTSRLISGLSIVTFVLIATATAQQCSTALDGNLVVAEVGSIVKVDGTGNNREVITSSSVNQAIGLDFDYQRNTLYWVDLQSAEIYALDEGSSKPRLVVPKQKQWLPISIAVESVTQKLYVGDGFSSTVRIFDLKDLKNEGIVVGENMQEVRSIGVDVNEGYLFVLDKFQILRTNLDGSSPKVLYKNVAEYENELELPEFVSEPIPVFRILVDADAKRLYWIDSIARQVISSNYDGEDKKTVFQANDGEPIHESLGSLALLGGYLYWSDVENNVVYKIDVQTGKSNNILDAAPLFVKAITCPRQKPIANPCTQHNGQCKHLCVLSKSNEQNYKCTCKVGYELAKDQKSCVKVREFLLFTQDQYIRGQSLNSDVNQGHDDVINPSQFPVGSLAEVDYDAESRVIFHSGAFPLNHLYQVSLDTAKEIRLEPDLLSKDVSWLAYDWVTKNLYYFTYYYADYITLSVLNVENPTYSKILVDNIQILVAGLVVHPHKGYVYFAQNLDDKHARIVRINSDGSDLKVIGDFGDNVLVQGLAIDFENDRLYWSQSERHYGSKVTYTLRNSNLDGDDVQSTNLPENLNPIEMAILNDQIYAINDSRTQLVRLNKSNLDNRVVLVEDSAAATLSGLKLYGKKIQSVEPTHPCAAGKHGCAKFCFAIPSNTGNVKGICGCPYGEKLGADGKSCVDNSKVEPPFKPCTMSFKCNKQTV